MTPRQRKAEQELRRQARELLDNLDEFKATWAAARRALLAEPGVRLLDTKTRRRLRPVPVGTRRPRPIKLRRRTERLDLLRYVKPGGPRRPSYWVVLWAPGWDDVSFFTLAEARAHFEGWARLPRSHRAPVLIEESDMMFQRELRDRAK